MFWSLVLSQACARSAPTLDNPRAPRHELGAVTRVFRFFALLSAFFVVAVRCLGGFPLTVACVSASVEVAESGVCPPSDHPADDDTLAPVPAFDSEDDGAEPALTPAPVEVSLLTFAEPSGEAGGVLAEQRALPSHAPSLERPPRS